MELLPPSEEIPIRINGGNSINYVQHSPVLFDRYLEMREEYNAATFSYRFRKMKTMKKLLLLEVFVFLVLVVFWSWTRLPAAVRFSGALLVDLSGLLRNPHMVFLFCNAIVFAVFLLCRRQTEISRNSDGDIVCRCGGTQAAEILAPLSPPEAAAEDSGAGEEEIIIKTVCWESVVLKPQCNEEAAAIALQQRQSGSSLESGAIENLNDEEFRRKIERFIRKNHEQFKVSNET